jgi:hypothetical protein
MDAYLVRQLLACEPKGVAGFFYPVIDRLFRIATHRNSIYAM